MAKLHWYSARIHNFLSKPTFFFITAFGISFVLSLARALMPFTSPWDEHTHLSYLQYVYSWQIPAEGYPMNTWAKDAFSCYGHALYGKLTDVPCGEYGDGSEYPSGGTNTSQIWPPVYFVIVALFMRIPMMFGLDPLMSARIITVIIWSLGVAAIGVIALKKSKIVSLSLGIVALLVSLPSFFFYTSYVSPHSFNPLIVAAVIFIADKYINAANYTYNSVATHTGYNAFLYAILNKWGFALIGLSVLVAFTIPQALTAFGFITFYVVLIFALSKWRNNLRWLFSYSAATMVFGLLSASVFYVINKFWLWQMNFRSIPFTSEVDTSRASLDIPEVEYTSAFEQIASVWWNFWPNGLVPEAPAGPDGVALITPWLIILTALSVAALLFWNESQWLGPLMLSLFVTAPIFSVLYDFIFPTGVPIRYGLVFIIIGILSFANRSISNWPRRVLVILAALTYLSAFAMNYMFVYRSCAVDEVTRLISCG